MNLARRLKTLFAQPRIPGVKRERRQTSLLPVVEQRYKDRAAQRGRSVSAVMADVLARDLGFDAATGKRKRARGVATGTKTNGKAKV